MANLKEELTKYGINYDEALERVDGDVDFYKSLAMKYLENDQYVTLVAAMEMKDYDAAYKAAHTLKGVAGNLSFNDLYKAAAAATEALKEGEMAAAEGFMPTITECHEKVIAGLSAWSNDEL